MPSALRGFVLCTCILLQNALLLRAQEMLSRTCANTKIGMEVKGFSTAANLVYTSLRPTCEYKQLSDISALVLRCLHVAIL